ncbi:helix-turn-helix transcriptional regulator [Enterobacter roggenkampii]|uniref:helix-turn-helix transcriptional regulator n=1 Tax=Enterobacter roggenkampii TaxID=1812935 RepID=UPI0015E53074|nr:AlpA family phage regulatory protein [Enterobacter roggenkampii]QLP23380.1 AlpA family phage regulatory protein [Enterobacter roggenkampii]
MTNISYPLSGNARAKQTANFLNISTVTLWRWTKNKPGFPKAIRLTERVTIYDANEVRQWVRAQYPNEGQ